jgi:hypothetical protein
VTASRSIGKRRIRHWRTREADPWLIPRREESDMDDLKAHIREVPDFPKPGILFYDITTLL